MPKGSFMALKTAQIGRCGELLVQYTLLHRGIESAQMTTDSGVDLVAYAPTGSGAITIQVKTTLKAKPSGGKGKPVLDWWLREDSPAQLVALADLSTKRVWLFTHEQVASLAQQKSSGRFHIYMHTDPTHKSNKNGLIAHTYDFEKYLLENCAHALFGI
jgi:hypothetical protein